MRLVPRIALLISFGIGSVALATPSGTKWFALPVTYRVFTHSQINGVTNFNANVLPGVQAAFSTWSQPTCTSWTIQYGGQFSSPSGTSAVSAQDRLNNVIWLGGSAWRHGSSTLGLTTTAFLPGSGEIIDADMEMNDNVVWSTSGSSAAFDMQSVVLHEAGHFLGLDHTPSSGSSVMFPSVAQGVVKRILTTVDSNDVCNVYPGSPGGQGSPCGTGLPACTGGRVCRGPAGGTSKICTVDCTSGQVCPTGYSCQNADTGKACLIPAGSPDLCKFCTDGSQCSTGNCVTDGRHNWCTVSCTSSVSCGAGYDCIQGGSGNVCVPIGACTAQCTSPTQCAVGFDCVSGRCEATGKIGDRCEISTYCGACGICIGNSTAAYCRSCCGGQGQGGACNNCPNIVCDGGYNCQMVTGATDSVCIPTVGAGSCGTCSVSSPCMPGLNCVGGRCHAPCNPSSPGTCAACFDVGGGAGHCACPGEVRYAGESCGPGPNGSFAACVTGLRCVGQPNTACRRPCVVGTSGSCQSNELCKTVDGVDVCVPSNTPGSACAACIGTSCDQGLTCFGGRCYPPCNPSSPTCGSCVQVPGGTGVCACEDQRAGANQACGFVAPGDVYTCQFGLTCVDSTCRAECNLSTPDCVAGTTCQIREGIPLCLPPISAQPDSGGTGGATDAGVTAPPPVNHGCGCQSSSASAAWWPLLMMAILKVRRQRTHL